MKKILYPLASVAFVIALAGCATSGGTAAAAPAAPTMASLTKSTGIDMTGPKASFDLHAVAIYTMDNESGGKVVDSSGNGNDATVVGNFEQAPGVFGKAMVFDGSSYLQVPTAVQKGSGFTFSAWVKPAAWPDWARVFDFGDGSTSDTWCGFSGVEHQMRFDIFGSLGHSTVLGPTLPIGKWSNIAVTLDGTNACMYINGKLTQKAPVKMLPKNVIKKNDYIGHSNWSADPIFSGMMDDILIADVAYTPDQIMAIARGIPVKK